MYRLLQNTGFRIHLIVYAAVNVLLIVLNLARSPDKLWFIWPLLAWGAGLLGHAYLVTYALKRDEPSHSQMATDGETELGALQVQMIARELWDSHGTKAIAEAAQKAQAFEAVGNQKQGQTWRRIEHALKQMSGPHVS
ncbi:MAG: 2TM domain-containing protein [Deltaproteobacteria bacterium]